MLDEIEALLAAAGVLERLDADKSTAKVIKGETEWIMRSNMLTITQLY